MGLSSDLKTLASLPSGKTPRYTGGFQNLSTRFLIRENMFILKPELEILHEISRSSYS